MKYDHGGERRGAADTLGFAFCRQIGERGSHQDAADAETEDVGRLFARDLTHNIQRFERTEIHVVFEAQIGMLFRRIGPRDDKYRVAPVQHVLDQAVPRTHVKDVVLVDPRGHEKERARPLCLGRRFILDELHQLVLMDHLARSRCEIFADLESLRVVGGQINSAFTPFEIVQQVLKPIENTLPVRLEKVPFCDRVQTKEVGRGSRTEDLPCVEVGAEVFLRAFRQSLKKIVHRFFEHEMRVSRDAPDQVA